MLHLEPHRLRVPDFIARVEYSQSIDSTNDAARRLAVEVPPGAGLLVVAEEQTAGRGRGANKWWTGAGSLAFSLLFDPSRYAIETRFSCMVPLAAAVAIVDVVTRRMGTPAVGIRWPNDVYVGERKLAGLLVEVPTVSPASRAAVVMGLGLNVNNRLDDAPADVRRRGAALVDLGLAPADLTFVLVRLLARLRGRIDDLIRQDPQLAADWQSRCLLRGRTVTLEQGPRTVRGRCLGIEIDGSLALETDRGAERFYAGVLTSVE